MKKLRQAYKNTKQWTNSGIKSKNATKTSNLLKDEFMNYNEI